MADIFISYPHDEQKDASFFASILQTKGLSTWAAVTDLSPGDNWKQKIDEALRNAGAIVFFVYPRHEPSQWMEREYMEALDSYYSGTTRILVPLLIGPKAEPPGFLRQWQSLRVENKSDWDRAASQLAEWIRTQQQVRSEPSEKVKREFNQRLNEITKQAKKLGSMNANVDERAVVGGHKTVFRSSRTGELRQVGTKKSRSSKEKK